MCKCNKILPRKILSHIADYSAKPLQIKLRIDASNIKMFLLIIYAMDTIYL